jgi:tryptophan-rich sensory protein
MAYDPAQQSVVDDEHLRLLAIGYYVSAAITACFSFIGLMYAFMGAAIGLAVSKSASEAATQPNQPSPEFLGWIFGAIGMALFVAMIAMAALKFFAGRSLKQHKSRTFCMIVAALSCLEVPYGTLLGVFTFMVLERPSVARRFGVNKLAPTQLQPNFPLPPPPHS